MGASFPIDPAEVADAARRNLELGLDALLRSFAAAQDAGLDAGAILAQHLRESMGDAYEQLPPVVRMMLG
jgi:hypothetical protein